MNHPYLDLRPISAIRPPSYPARPVNGGPLPKAQPKHGEWIFEAKYNGWRAWVHVPTGAMFNRKNQPLSITDEFRPALAKIKAAFSHDDGSPVMEWLDVEALERRHNFGRGTLIILDSPNAGKTWSDRHLFFGLVTHMRGIAVHKELNKPLAPDSIYFPMSWTWNGADRAWNILQQCNTALGCKKDSPFFEGIVAKRADSLYPIQLRSPDQEFPFWMKHRWQF